MDNDKSELTRARAYEIWEKEGRPAGRESEHWRQAELELEEAASGSVDPQDDATIGGGVSTGAPPATSKPGRRKATAKA